jgi:flagellar export protein FliJ
MKSLITTLERLRSIRNKKVSVLTVQLAQQKTLCLRHENNIKTLNFLFARSEIPGNTLSAGLLNNHIDYKRNITRVIDWQKQEYALAKSQITNTQKILVCEARKEKTLAIVAEDNSRILLRDENRKQQLNMDSLATQCWIRKNSRP